MKLGELELLRESLVAVVAEMRANVIHASFSSVIYEGRDFSCGLLTHDGRLLAQSLDDNPIHIFAVPYSAREIIRRYGEGIKAGDIYLHNEPYTGGTHLNDVLCVEPIFSKDKLLAFAAVRCHWGDVGGMTAGSISGRATEIFQEGMRIPPIRIAQNGRISAEITALLFSNMRAPVERAGDFNTMVGACHKAAEHVEKLVRRFGDDNFGVGIETLISNAEAVMRQKISTCAKGEYCAEGYIESNGHVNEPLVARLRLSVLDDRVNVNFWEASPQTAGPTNVGPVMAINSAGTILKAFLDPGTSMNHGSFQPISVSAPEGSFINARPPVACGGSVEVKVLLDALIAGALGQAIPERMVGDLKGGGNHIYISGHSMVAGRRRFYLFYEYPAGGTGATARGDGCDVLRTYTEGDFNTFGSAEVIESEMPLRVEQVAIRSGSHGHGMYRGGCGLVRDIKVLQDNATLSVLTDKAIIPPYGVAGAHSGKGNLFSVLRNGAVIETSPLPGKIAGFPLQAGDVIRMETAGGGGYGDPLRRDLRRVADDVVLGYTDRESASERYGIVLKNNVIDEKATNELRSLLHNGAIFVTVSESAEDVYAGARRLFAVSKPLAEILHLGHDHLCELLNPQGPSLRGWARIQMEDDSDSKLPLGPFARAILRCSGGDRFELRPIR